jgi:glycerophosphoryl diester phosphodiesterase
MTNRLRVLSAVFAAAIALIVLAQSAHADSTDEIVVAHRGANTSRYAEGTLPANQYAVRNRADLLDGDVRWTKDGPDSDSVGTMIILHDATLDRITNCRGTVSSWLWSSISARCRSDVGGQKLMRLVDLLKYGNSLGKSFALELKVASITDAQAKQFWNAIKNSRVQLAAMSAQLAPVNKDQELRRRRPQASDQLCADRARDWRLAVGVHHQGDGRRGPRQTRDPRQCRQQLPASQHQGVLVYREE